jgi:lipocalin
MIALSLLFFVCNVVAFCSADHVRGQSANQMEVIATTETETEEVKLPVKLPLPEVPSGLIPVPELPGFLKPSDVGPIDIDAYMGRWYEMYSSQIPMSTFEKDAYCVTADYTLQEDMDIDKKITFDFLNSMRKGGPEGDLEIGSGEATNILVKFQTPLDGLWYLQSDDGKYMGQYVIQAVGPIESGKYAWAIVSDVLRTSVWILARDTKKFNMDFDADVLEKAKDKGFKMSWNKPIKSEQPNNCKYAELPQ